MLAEPAQSSDFKALTREVYEYKRATYAVSTKVTYGSQLLCYLRFCIYFGRPPIPVDQLTLLTYTAFLARGLKPSSIPPYLNIIRIIHCERGYPNPLQNNFELLCLKKGIARLHGTPAVQKLPITTDILLRVKSVLSDDSFDKVFWSCLLIGFFGFFRKATLLPRSATNFGSCILIRDLHIMDCESFKITLHRTKTIQFGQRVLEVPFCAAPAGSVLCPMVALRAHLALLPADTTQPLFSFQLGDVTVVITHAAFVKRLRDILTVLGFQPSKYSGHFLRRGGATHAFNVGLSPFLIKCRGDWASSCFERYVCVNAKQSLLAARALTMVE